MAWAKLSSVTLCATGDNLNSGTICATTFVNVYAFMEQCSSSITGNTTFNSDTGANYARRRSNNYAADGTGTAESAIDIRGGESKNRLEINFIYNTSAQEKIVMGWLVVAGPTSGAGTAPDITHYSAKWANTSAQITEINFNNIDPGDYGTNSNITVIGTD